MPRTLEGYAVVSSDDSHNDLGFTFCEDESDAQFALEDAMQVYDDTRIVKATLTLHE